MEWRCDALRKYIYDIIVGVRPAVELRPKCILPFLSLNLILGSGRVQDESFKLHLANASDFGPYFERQISIRLVGIGQLDEPDLGIEVRADFPPFKDALQPIRAISQ